MKETLRKFEPPGPVRHGGPPGAPLAPPSGGEPAMPPSLSGAPIKKRLPVAGTGRQAGKPPGQDPHRAPFRTSLARGQYWKSPGTTLETSGAIHTRTTPAYERAKIPAEVPEEYSTPLRSLASDSEYMTTGYSMGGGCCDRLCLKRRYRNGEVDTLQGKEAVPND